MPSIFSVTNRDLDQLTEQAAVDIFRDLLFAEASTLGIGKNLVNVPSAITVADGGIDAEVKDVEFEGGQGIIKKGLTRYQIKTGDYSPNRQENIKGILYKEGLTELKPRVKACFENKGTFILVLFGWDDPETEDNQIINKIKKQLESTNPEYNDAKIEIWRQNNLIGFLQPFPSLSLKINKKDKARLQTHKSWGSQDDMKVEFKAGADQESLIKNCREELEKDDAATHIRILGEPGVGKTRIVYEITKKDNLSPIVIYCDSANKFRDSDLMNEILKDDNNFSVILVVDECDSDSRSYIWNKLKHLGPRVKLVTIYNEYEESSGNTLYFEAPLLQDGEISKIIQEYGIVKDQADRWSAICSGSPRVAHVIGWNLKNNPEDILKPLDTVDIWRRYIVGCDDPASQEVSERKLVLQNISLFKKIGYGKTAIKEAQSVAQLVEEADPHITWARFQQIIKKMRERKILQGENLLYITPKALHVKLWIDWWETFGGSFDFNILSSKIPESLHEWFYDMFQYAAESQAATRVVRELLGENGPFQKDDYLKTRLGGSFFLALTEADPKSALKTLQQTVGKWEKSELIESKESRRTIVWALEKIVVWKELFADASKLLLLLAEAENETYANNASGIFTDLFSPGPGRVAPTEASPEERFIILQEALNSTSREKRKLALDACNKALETNYFHRMIGVEYQGLRKEAKLWSPVSHQETVDAYIRVWRLLYDKLDSFEEDERQYAIKILLGHIRGLTKILGLVETITQDINGLIDKKYVNKKDIVDAIEGILHYDKKRLPEPVVKKWEEIRDSLVGTDFHSLMERYVGMDLLEDKFDDDGNHVDKAAEPIKNLAKQATQDHKLLIPELEWLHTQEAKSGYRFGYELGMQDKSFSLLPILLEAQKKVVDNEKASDFFIGGYLKAFFEVDPEGWEGLFDSLTKDEKLKKTIPALTWRSGMSDRAALRILELAKEKVITASDFGVFGLGSVISDLSEDIFLQWIEFLLSSDDDYAASIALDLFQFFYIRKESKYTLPKNLSYRVLTQPSLFKEVKDRFRNQMDEWHWKEIGNKFVETYPDNTVPLAEVILENFGEKGGIFEDFYSETQEVLLKITEKHPLKVWDIVIKYLGPPIDSRAFHIREWLRGSGFFEERSIDALSFFSEEKIWEWVDEDINKRAWYIAYIAPKAFFKQEGKTCWAREILARYGDREDVSKEMGANFYTEGWTGPASQHYQKKKIELLAFKQGEDNENVKKWIDEMIDSLEKQIEHEKIQEERRGF